MNCCDCKCDMEGRDMTVCPRCGAHFCDKCASNMVNECPYCGGKLHYTC